MQKPFSMQFEEQGGYDAMTSAYTIYDAQHKVVCTVDVCDYITDTESWEGRHAECPEAEAIANQILEALR